MNKSLYILFFALSLFSSFARAEGTFERKTFGKYTVSISRNYENGTGTLIIYQNNKKVFEETDTDSHYYFGSDFGDTENYKDIYSGRDITGNGIPDLVISNWTGGAHCCHFLYVFELGKSLKKLTTVKAGSSRVNLVDIDHDGSLEIEFWDGPIDYLFASFAGSPGGKTILKFTKDRYEVAPQFMRRREPDSKQLYKLLKKIKRSFVAATREGPDLPFAFLDAMMSFSYSGHYDLAMKVADVVWPTARPGLVKFKKDFSEALSTSEYWRALNR